MSPLKSGQGLGQEGIALIVTLLFLLIFSVMGVMLMYSITSTVKTSGLLSQEAVYYYGTEGGVLSVAGWMTFYKQTDVPEDVLSPTNSSGGGALYSATSQILSQTVRNPVGFSSQWKGVDVLIDSVSPPPSQQVNGVYKEVQAVVFIPNAPVGYGNE